MRGFGHPVYLLLILLIGCILPEKMDERPNVIIILTDDQGWGDLGRHGNQWVSTPNLDGLGENSVEFERFYVSPVCAPTRASLLTGRYHLSTGTTWVTHRKEVMRSDETTIAELLKKNGYRTGLFGKWHQGKQYPHDPNGQGFDTFFGFKEGHFNNYFDAEVDYNQEKVQTNGYLPDLLTDSVISFLQGTGPFFSLVAYNTPHGPFQVPDRYFKTYKSMGLDDKNAAVYGMVENIDDNVGRILTALDSAGKADNTVVIFLCDNGPNGDRFNGGLKGWKGHVDEGGVRSPFFIRYPKREWISGKVSSGFGAHIDILPTLAEVIGIQLDSALNIHGRSLVDLIEGEELPDRTFFTHQVRQDFDTIPGAVRTNEFLVTLKPGDTSLYNVLLDPGQQNDIFGDEPAVANRLLESYRDWFIRSTEMGIEPDPVEVGYGGVPDVELPAQEVTGRRGVEFKGGFGWANDYLTGWTDESEIVWEVNAVATRKYQVAIELSCVQSPGGVLHISVGTVPFTISVGPALLKQQIESPDRAPRGEVYAYKWPTVLAGIVTIPEGKRQITLSSRGMNDLEVKSVKLTLIEEDESS